MKVKRSFIPMNSQFATVLVAGAAACLLYSVPVRADSLEISIESPINVNAGTSGNGFDVLLTNLSGPAVSLAGLTFEISVPSTDIQLSEVNTATLLDPYIFSGNSLFGPNITVSNTGQDLSASDLYSVIGSGITLGAGATVGLGHILFDVSATAHSETVPVTFTAFPATSLSDDLSNNVPINTLTNGQIDIIGTVPEPSYLLLLLTAGAFLLVGRTLRVSRPNR
jgi:hypothetical protein